MKKLFLKLLPIVAVLFPDLKLEEGTQKLELDEEAKKKLDAEAGQDGFAEAFMKYYNDEYLQTNAEANEAFSQFMEALNQDGPTVETADANAEDIEVNDPQEVPTADAKTWAQKLNAVVKKADALLKTNAQLAADNEKLKVLPEEDEPEAVIKINTSKQNTVPHSKTHLFSSGKSWDSLDRPWNERAAKAKPGQIKGATVWNKVNIDKLNEDLGAFARRNPSEIMSLLMDGYSIPSNWRIVSNVQDEFVFASIVTGEITQGFKRGWLPKNNQRFVPIKNKIFDKQIDITWEPSELKSIEKTWLNMFFNEGSTPYKMSFAGYLLNELRKKARKEDKITIFKGVHYDSALLPEGVPGAFMNSMDGFLKLISKYRDVAYKSHSLGKPTEENIYDYVTNWVKQLPYDFRILPGLRLGLSGDWHRAYHNAREAKKGTNTDYDANNVSVDQFENIKFQPLEQINGSDFMYITTDDNIGLMVDVPGEEDVFTIEKRRRLIDAFADYKIGVYFKALGAAVDPNAPLDYENQIFFSNDVEVVTDVYVPVASNDATPTVADHSALIIGANNTAATNITQLDDVVAGEFYYLYGNSDTNISTVVNGANIVLDGAANFALNKGNLLVLIGLADGKVIEYSRTLAGETPEPIKVQLAADATVADAAEGTWFVTQDNTAATAITTIDNALEGEVYTIEGVSDANSTTIANGGNFLLTADFTASDGAYLKVRYNGSKFVETKRG
ncbi:MAG: hypothetical protein AB3N16_08035 [Flavobacteriaceae bacterium]